MIVSGAQSPAEESFLSSRPPSATYQYHNAPEVAPAHGLENEDSIYPSSDKIVVPRDFDRSQTSNGLADRPRAPRIIFGMKLQTFAIVALCTVLIIIAAAVGGAVGGQNIRLNQVSQEASAPQSSSVVSQGADIQPTSNCTSVHNMTYVSSYAQANPPAESGLRFQRYCDVGDPLQSSDAKMIGASYSPSFSDCIDTCAAYNYWNQGRNCTVATFQANATRPSNCLIGHVDSYDANSFSESPGRDVALIMA